jgi:Na+/H+ antiporter NhaD/arsenite permease-like protein
MSPSAVQIIAGACFAVAVIHTFSTAFFERLARRQPDHAGIFHLLGEVEVVFGFWAMVMTVTMLILVGRDEATAYLDHQNYTEPMFVFAIMVVAGSKPILHAVLALVRAVAAVLPLPGGIAFYFVALSLVPLLGSLVTEPAAMTLAALVLRDRYYRHSLSNRLKYATLGVLFVNVSIGGTLTPFAAPPVLMVAGKWGWGLTYMLTTFGWKAALAVAVNALVATLLFRRELSTHRDDEARDGPALPVPVIVIHLMFLIGVVVFAHHPPMFMGLLLFFLGFAHAYRRYQDRLILREGLLVAFFLAGLVVLGGQQQWWLQSLLAGMSTDLVYFGATLLTAITDNAALTYLGSLVQGVGNDYKYALVAGAVTGGGLTIIANAPNPAGFAILRDSFGGALNPVYLLAAAIPPTLVTIIAFWLL